MHPRIQKPFTALQLREVSHSLCLLSEILNNLIRQYKPGIDEENAVIEKIRELKEKIEECARLTKNPDENFSLDLKNSNRFANMLMDYIGRFKTASPKLKEEDKELVFQSIRDLEKKLFSGQVSSQDDDDEKAQNEVLLDSNARVKDGLSRLIECLQKKIPHTEQFDPIRNKIEDYKKKINGLREAKDLTEAFEKFLGFEKEIIADIFTCLGARLDEAAKHLKKKAEEISGLRSQLKALENHPSAEDILKINCQIDDLVESLEPSLFLQIYSLYRQKTSSSPKPRQPGAAPPLGPQHPQLVKLGSGPSKGFNCNTK